MHPFMITVVVITVMTALPIISIFRNFLGFLFWDFGSFIAPNFYPVCLTVLFVILVHS